MTQIQEIELYQKILNAHFGEKWFVTWDKENHNFPWQVLSIEENYKRGLEKNET